MPRTNAFSAIMQTARTSQDDDRGVTTLKTRGRPVKGKSSNPAYESTTIYLPKATKRKAMKMLVDDKNRGLSDVLGELLEEWVERQE